MRIRSLRRQASRLLIVLFIAAINLPLLAVVLDFDPHPLNRNRIPQRPRTLRGLLTLPGSIQYFYNEGFGFRSALIGFHAQLVHEAFDTSPSRRIIIGREGWLFIREVLDDYRRIDPMSEQDLAAWSELFDRRAQFCAQRNIPYLFMMGPDKTEVYGERFLPNWVHRADGPSRLDQLIAHLDQSGSQVAIVDPRNALLEASARERTYHRTDTHWNEWGAFVAYRELTAAMRASGFQIEPIDETRIQIESNLSAGGDLARLAGSKQRLTESLITTTLPDDRCPLTSDGQPVRVETIDVSAPAVTRTTCSQGEIDRGVVFHDSFGIALVPFLARNFREAVFVRTDAFDPEVVDRERPSVVLQIMVERRLSSYDPRVIDKSGL